MNMYLGFTARQDFHSFWAESIVRWVKMGDLREKTPDHPQAELVLSHMWPEQGSNPISEFYYIVCLLLILCTFQDILCIYTPGKRSTCTPSVYSRKSIWPVSAEQLTCINKHVADRVTKFNVSLYFYFNFGCKSENAICCGNKYE